MICLVLFLVLDDDLFFQNIFSKKSRQFRNPKFLSTVLIDYRHLVRTPTGDHGDDDDDDDDEDGGEDKDKFNVESHLDGITRMFCLFN